MAAEQTEKRITKPAKMFLGAECSCGMLCLTNNPNKVIGWRMGFKVTLACNECGCRIDLEING